MCKKKPGLRCSNYAKCALDAHKKTLDTATNDLVAMEERADAGELNDMSARDYASFNAKMTRLRETKARLEKETITLESEYHMTPAGQDELLAASQDPNLSDEDRAIAAAKHKLAVAGAKKHKKDYDLQLVKQENLKHVLSEAGVDADTIADIVAFAGSNKGNPHPRPVGEYEEALKNARKRYAELKAKAKAAENDVADEAAEQGWDAETEAKALAKVRAKFAKPLHIAKESNLKARFNYDSTDDGQKILEEKIAKTNPLTKYEELARLRARLNAVKKSHAVGLSDRRNKEVVKEKIETAMRAVGKDPKPALTALTTRVLLNNSGPTKEAWEQRTQIRTYVNPKADARIQREFEKSPEFKASGQDAYNDYVVRRILSPLPKQTAKSIDKANSQAEVGFDARKHRHLTSSEGNKSVWKNIKLTAHQSEKVEATARSLHMTKASFVNAVLDPNINPFAIQNDRSKDSWEKKTAAVKARFAEERAAA